MDREGDGEREIYIEREIDRKTEIEREREGGIER